MKKYSNTMLRASRILSEAFDLDDPMNNTIETPEDSEFAAEFEAGQTTDKDNTYDLDVGNPVCPCCGARLNIIDDATVEEPSSDIEAMDPTLEPDSMSYGNEDAFVTIDDDFEDEPEEESEEETEDEESEEEDDEDSGEKVEAF